MELKNTIVLVTGGSSGIGKAMVEAFAAEGAKVIFTYNTNENGANELSKIAEKFRVEVTNQKEVAGLFGEIEKKYGHLDILINNAGRHIFSDDQLDMDYWTKTFDTYLFSVVNCTQQTIRLMGNGGKIINISSIYSEEKMGEVGLIPYSAAKAAINSLTRTLAKKMQGKILVNAIAPGYTDTPGWGKLTPERKEQLGKDQLIGRFIKPEEIAQMAVAIAENDAMTGEVVVVDGGISLKTV